MEIKDIGFENYRYGINGFGEFMQDDEESFVPVEMNGSFVSDMSDYETESVVAGSKKNKDNDRGERYEDYRVLQTYFRDMITEPLLTPSEEKEIAAQIKKCQERVRKIQRTIDRFSKRGINKEGKNSADISGEEEISGRIDRLTVSMEVYSKKAKVLKQRFAKANLRFVIRIAKRYTGRGLPFADLIQEGNIGLIKAVERFDHTKGYKFLTYASWWIQQSIARAIAEKARTVRVPVYIQEKASKVFRINSDLHRVMERKPLPEEIAKEAGISPEGVKQILEATNNIVSLDSPIKHGDQGTLLDLTPDEELSLQDSIIENAKFEKILREALSLLTPREKKIIMMRFGIDQETQYTLDEIGKEFNLTRERIRQIEKGALQKIAVSEMGEILNSFL